MAWRSENIEPAVSDKLCQQREEKPLNACTHMILSIFTQPWILVHGSHSG